MIDVSKIEKLMALMGKHGFDFVQAESAGEKISLARNMNQAFVFQPQANSQVLSQQASQMSAHVSSKATSVSLETEEAVPSQSASTKIDEANNAKKYPEGTTITSPFVGTFYRSPSPEAAPFIEIGSRIRKGQSLCIVEAMKLMNEIESEIDGEIVAILAENAKPVEFGTPLFIVAPLK